MSALLQVVGKGSDHQIATEAQGRSSTMQLVPGTPQLLCRQLYQRGDVAFDLGEVRAARPVFRPPP